MNTSTRYRGAVVTVLDGEKLLTAARAEAASQYPDMRPESLHSIYQQMLMVTSGGRHAVVNSEGVGSREEDGRLSVWLVADMTVMPVEVSVPAVLAARTAEAIDLADGIRTFGIRLDVNHGLWAREYDPAANPA